MNWKLFRKRKKDSSLSVEVPGVSVGIKNPFADLRINQRRVYLAVGLLLLGLVALLGLVFGAFNIAEFKEVLMALREFISN